MVGVSSLTLLRICRTVLCISTMYTLIIMYAIPSFDKNATKRNRVDSVAGTADNLV